MVRTFRWASLVFAAQLLAAAGTGRAADIIPPTTETAKIQTIVSSMMECSALPAGYSYRVGTMMPRMSPTFTVGTSTGSVVIFTKMEGAMAPKGDTDKIVQGLLPAYASKDGFAGDATGRGTVGGVPFTYVEGRNTKSRGEKMLHGALRTPGGAVVCIDSTATPAAMNKLLGTVKGWK